MLTNTLQHIDEIIVRIDVMQPTGDQQALHIAPKLCIEKYNAVGLPVTAVPRKAAGNTPPFQPKTHWKRLSLAFPASGAYA